MCVVCMYVQYITSPFYCDTLQVPLLMIHNRFLLIWHTASRIYYVTKQVLFTMTQHESLLESPASYVIQVPLLWYSTTWHTTRPFYYDLPTMTQYKSLYYDIAHNMTHYKTLLLWPASHDPILVPLLWYSTQHDTLQDPFTMTCQLLPNTSPFTMI